MGLKAKFKRGPRCPQEDKRKQSKVSSIDLRQANATPELHIIADGMYGKDLDPAIHKENEQYRARLAKAISTRMSNSDHRYEEFKDRTHIITISASRRWYAHLPKWDPRSSEGYIGRFAHTMEQCIWAMDDPYRLSRAPWSTLEYTPDERWELERIIFLRYMAGWHAEDSEMLYQLTGEKHEQLVRRIEVELRRGVHQPKPSDAGKIPMPNSAEELASNPLPQGFKMRFDFDSNHVLKAVRTIQGNGSFTSD